MKIKIIFGSSLRIFVSSNILTFWNLYMFHGHGWPIKTVSFPKFANFRSYKCNKILILIVLVNYSVYSCRWITSRSVFTAYIRWHFYYLSILLLSFIMIFHGILVVLGTNTTQTVLYQGINDLAWNIQNASTYVRVWKTLENAPRYSALEMNGLHSLCLQPYACLNWL